MSYAIDRDQIRERPSSASAKPSGCRLRGIPIIRATSTPRSTPSTTRKSEQDAGRPRARQADANGIRLLPNGKPATIEISVVPAFGPWPDVALLVAKDWEEVGIKTIVQIRERALHFKMHDNNELMCEIWNEDTRAFPFTGNAKHDLRNAPILTSDPCTRWYNSGRQGRAGADAGDEEDRRDRRHRPHRVAGGSDQGRPGALQASSPTRSSRSASSA